MHPGVRQWTAIVAAAIVLAYVCTVTVSEIRDFAVWPAGLVWMAVLAAVCGVLLAFACEGAAWAVVVASVLAVVVFAGVWCYVFWTFLEGHFSVFELAISTPFLAQVFPRSMVVLITTIPFGLLGVVAAQVLIPGRYQPRWSARPSERRRSRYRRLQWGGTTGMKQNDVLGILRDVPDYRVFLTVDKLKASARQLAKEYPDAVEILPVGRSRKGDPIEALKIGDGPKRALLFAMPHPNEPIGSMMLEYLSRRLAEDDALRRSLGYTWVMVKCIDPDGTRLNEGWFRGPFSLDNYARHYYRPPSFQQVEWTFPVDYKTLHFHAPLPETQALMALIEQFKPDFIYSLHNSGFGGAYFYVSEDAPSLYGPFHELVASQGLPLHLGEPEIPFAKAYAEAVFELPPISASYDFLAEQTGADPAEIISGGTSSPDYARRFCDPFCLVCEMPYFYNPGIHDASPSGMVRRDAILQGAEQARKDLACLQEQYDAVEDALTVDSPFRDSIKETLRTFLKHIEAQENWARTDPKTAEMATVAEKLDSLVIGKFYRLLSLGMFVRMLDAQMAATGESPLLLAERETVRTAFEQRSAELQAELAYDVIPIQKLVRVQLGSALLAAGYAAGRGTAVE